MGRGASHGARPGPISQREFCMRICFVGLILFALPLTTLAATQVPEANFGIASDIQYCTGGGKPLLMDVFVPRNRAAAPTACVGATRIPNLHAGET